jgi:hypothetical protein
MNVEAHKKSARAAKEAPKVESDSDMPAGGVYFTPELIARVATFAEAVVQRHDGASDVKNICLAVGPMPSRIIKHVYLKKNMRYLEKVIRKFLQSGLRAAWARECHLAWMSVNTGWRNLITDELMKRYEKARFTDLLPKIHPLLAFVNPAVAIEMDVLETLKYLVEVKGIDINAKRWVGLSQGVNIVHYHLIALAIRVDNYNAFRCLMSADAIDIYSTYRYFRASSLHKTSVFCYAIDRYIQDENKKRYFEAFVKHAKFQANARSFTGYDPRRLHTGLAVTCLHYFVQLLRRRGIIDKVLDAVENLLDVGADPELEFNDLSSPLGMAIQYRAAQSGSPRVADDLNRVIQIMSEHPNSS